MKPINLNTTGCDPVSSNCVIWQGPDIPCLKLCKGDSISDVVYKAATELCDLLEALDVSTFTLPPNCFPDACTPKDFHDLIQIIINKLCCLEGIPGNSACSGTGLSPSGARLIGETTTTGGCPDCTVEIAKCFHYTNEFGDLVTTMQLTDYTRAIGNRLCDLVNEVTNITYAISDLSERVAALEAAPAPTVLLPQVTPTCVVTPAVPTDMSFVLSVLEQQFCQLVTATGTPNAISSAIIRQCLNLTNDVALGTSGGTMGSIPGWIATSNTLASSLNNMWLTLCDVRSAVRNIQLNCCPSGCDGIEVTLQATISGSDLRLFINGTISTGFNECNPLGNLFTITDTLGNQISTRIDTVTYLNDPLGFTVALAGTPISLVSDLTISSDLCYTNGNDTCQFCLTYTLVNRANCPQLFVTPLPGESVSVTFNPIYVPATYTIQVWDSLFTTVVATQTQYLAVYGGATFTFSGLAASTVYNVRLLINIGTTTTECAAVPFTTLPIQCIPPTFPVANIELPVYCDTCGPAIDFVDNPTVDGTYVDLTSNYLYEYSGGSFGNPIALTGSATVTTLQVGSTTVFRNSVYANGKVFVASGAGAVFKIEVLDYNGGAPTIEETISIALVAPLTGAVNSMCYDPSTNLIYILGMPVFGTLAITTLAYTGPGVYTINDAVVTLGGVLYPWRIENNPFNGKKYITSTTGALYVFTAGATPTYIGPVLSPGTGFYRGNLAINPVNGDVWVTTADTTGTDEVYVINGTTDTVITAVNAGVAGYAVDSGSVNGPMHTITYSPENGGKIIVLYTDTATGTLYNLVQFDVNAPYTASVFYTDATVYLAGIVNAVSYSYTLNKIIYNQAGVLLRAFEPTNSAVYFDALPAAVGNIVCPIEDVANKQMVFYNFANTPTPNVFWYGLDPVSATECTQNIVDMTIGSSTLYEFDTVTQTWSAMCTSSASVAGTTVTVTATLSANVVTAALAYSTDYGLTWTALADTGGTLFANPAIWLAGRTYAKPLGATNVKVTFSTASGCGFEGISMSI